MRLTAIAVVSALFASTASAAGAPAASSSAIPPMIVNVTTAADMSAELVARMLAEADGIWLPGGVTFIWRRAARVVVPYSRVSETGPYVPTTLRVSLGDSRGAGRDGRMPLGWIVFDDVSAPQQEIHLSYANALALMDQARGVVGIVAHMPIAQREMFLARALGRALAHELGHYLLASREHTARGLMKATLTAVELFMPDTVGFRIEPAQCRAVAARLRGEPLVANR